MGLAVAVFVAIAGGGIAFAVAHFRDDGEAEVSAPEAAPTEATEVVAPTPTAKPSAAVPEPEPVAVPPADVPVASHPSRTLDPITWTIATTSTFDDLVQAWSLPRETMVALNPDLSATDRLEVGTHVVVHRGSIDGAESVGPPNDGKLIGGIPFPEGPTWLLAPDRTRAYGTGETLLAVVAALDAYAAKFPGAAPVQLGELSARRGGPIYGHQSHQAGRDIDIRLIVDQAAGRFDPERNWFLIKTLIDGGDVVAIFLNRSQQVWLRAAAEADVGIAGADSYFAFISHEPGHTIHFHTRFRCPDSDRRCVVYSVGETSEEAPKISKLPGGGGGLGNRKGGKLIKLTPKLQPRRPSGGKLPGAPAKRR